MVIPDPVLAQVTRDGVVESVHRGHVAVCGPDGRLLSALGDGRRDTYIRSAVKPFQALAVLEELDTAGIDLSGEGLAIACASHYGSDDHQIEAAHLLSVAGLDESALRCPPALPVDRAADLDQREPTALAHNCSGKHAAFLLAQVAAGRDPSTYLETGDPLQQSIRRHLERVCDASAHGPGVDGCGAPAWRVPLAGLATAFARLIQADEPDLARVKRAMCARPDLIGGSQSPDTELMRADERVVAKRGAEAVFAAGGLLDGGAVGIAVKISDGSNRAAAPVVAAVLEALGATVPSELLRPLVLGGGEPHGALEVGTEVSALALRV
jgi:L-asparaginase II